jgi:hypothetical protein
MILFVAVGCGKSETERLKGLVAGSHEAKFKEYTFYAAIRIHYDTRAESAADWKIVGEEVQLNEIRGISEQSRIGWLRFKAYRSKYATIYKIEPNGNLTAIARIKDEKREDIPNDKQFSLKILNSSMPSKKPS